MNIIGYTISKLNLISTAVFGFSIFAGIFPFLTKAFFRDDNLEKYRVLLNVFTGGMQLATILVDLIPHMVMDEKHSHEGSHLYPFVAVGSLFLFLLGIDHLYIHKGSAHKHIEKTKPQELIAKKAVANPQDFIIEEKAGPKSCCMKSKTDVNTEQKIETQPGNKACCSNHNNTAKETSSTAVNVIESKTEVLKNKSFRSGGCCGSTLENSHSFGNAMLRIFAISAHSFFEGFAVNENSNGLPLLFGLVLHKLLESFNVAVALVDLQFAMYKKVILFLFYAVLTPLSISLKGLSLFTRFSEVQLWCNALCLGALIFVVFYEIITPSFRARNFPYSKMLSITLGYVLGCVAIVFAHSNGHSCSGNHDH